MILPDYWLEQPGPPSSDQDRQAFDELWQAVLSSGKNPLIDYILPAPKRQFLSHIADHHNLALHGSGNLHIELFEPRQSNDLNPFGAQKAVYASSDALWAMFFAITDRQRFDLSISNACIRLIEPGGQVQGPFYFFSLSQSALPLQPWREGMMYLLPRLTFIDQPPMTFGDLEVQIAQLASLSPVEPLARLPVSPADFPFLGQVRGHDDQRLAEYANALQTGAPLPD
jgi:hypothetical protein